MIDRATGNNLGYAFVEYVVAASAARAILAYSNLRFEKFGVRGDKYPGYEDQGYEGINMRGTRG